MTAKRVIFRNDALVPDCWKQSRTSDRAGARDFRAFNPSITSLLDGGYAMCYRVVAHNSDVRRLATCRLTADLEIVPGSVTALSDHITFASPDGLNERAQSWHADPRYLRLRGGIYLIWNDGAHRPENHQFMARMSVDGLTTVEPARELLLPDRRAIEKNWMFFETGELMWATYTIRPHTVLAVDFDRPHSIDCRPAASSELSSDYEDVFGVLRGGAQPLREGDRFTALAHSSYKTMSGRHYRACFYSFSASPPFEIQAVSAAPFDLPNPCGGEFLLPRLNSLVAEVVYPCGFVALGDDYVVSYGINDERCAIATVEGAAVRAAMVPASSASATRSEAPRITAPPVPEAPPVPGPPMFWWNAQGKRIDKMSDRRFAHGNFGDIASRDLVERILGVAPVPARPGQKRKLLAIGSVLHTAQNGDVVWGAGVKGSRLDLAPGVRDLLVHAVRGPLALAVLRRRGVDVSGVRELFDPGCLMPLLYEQEIAAHKESGPEPTGGIRIVPHFRDDVIMRRAHYAHLRSFVSVDCAPLEMVFALLGAERVFSTSLHGVIFAESLGIPTYWLASPGGEDGYKFYDYYYGTERYSVTRFPDLETALRADPMPLPVLRLEDYLTTFPYDAVRALMSAPAQPPSRLSGARAEVLL